MREKILSLAELDSRLLEEREITSEEPGVELPDGFLGEPLIVLGHDLRPAHAAPGNRPLRDDT